MDQAKPRNQKIPTAARKQFAANVRASLSKTTMSIADLSDNSGIKYLTTVSYVNGRRIPEGDVLDALAASLGTTPDKLMRGVEV